MPLRRRSRSRPLIVVNRPRAAPMSASPAPATKGCAAAPAAAPAPPAHQIRNHPLPSRRILRKLAGPRYVAHQVLESLNFGFVLAVEKHAVGWSELVDGWQRISEG